MSGQIIEMQQWLAGPNGQYLLAWEQEQMAQALANVFGFHALQLGLPQLNALQSNRIPHRWLAVPSQTPAPDMQAAQHVALVSDFTALPFPANSMDLVVLPHALELSVDPHGVLREATRVLLPEGRLAICGLNPFSLWGICQRWPRLFGWLGSQHLEQQPDCEAIGYLRLRDWLHLLDLEIEEAHFGCYRPSCASPVWLQRWRWMDQLGSHWWPILGSVYFVMAVKRVRGVTLINPMRKTILRLPVVPAAVRPYARQQQQHNRSHFVNRESDLEQY